MLASQLKHSRLPRLQRNRAAIVCRAVAAGAFDDHSQFCFSCIHHEVLCRVAVPTTKVSFKIHYRCNLGEHVCISGSGAALGNWTVQKAVQMQWSADDVWVLDLEVDDACVTSWTYAPFHESHYQPCFFHRPIVDLEYKYLVRGATGEAVAWMEDDNLTLSIPVMNEDGKRAECIVVHDAWDKAFQKVNLGVKRVGSSVNPGLNLVGSSVNPGMNHVGSSEKPSTGPASDSWMAGLLSPVCAVG
jgi:hypothetical protein